jgi:hypothetical protein
VWMPASASADLGGDRIAQRLGAVAATAVPNQLRERWARKMSG